MRPIVLLTSLLLACGSDTVNTVNTDGGAAGSITDEGTTAASPPPSTSTSTSTSGADETTADPSAGFLESPDIGAGGECNTFIQDCPPGLKCMPYANDGSLWNDTGCFPIAEDPAAPGEPCTVEEGGTSGIDTCALGSMCWDVDPKTNEGVCTRMCTGDRHSRLCEDPGEYCHFLNSTPVYVCTPICNPLLDECEEGFGCYLHLFGQAHGECLPDASGPEAGAAGDPCILPWECDPGTYCALPGVVPECMSARGCCTSYCTVGDDSPCLTGQTCQSLSSLSGPLPGYEDLGACVLP